MPDEPVLIFAHAEEIIALFAVFRSGLMVRALAVHQFFFHIETFAADAVISFITAKINIPRVVNFCKIERTVFM